MPQPLKEEELDLITKKVYALYAKYGADRISMDEVSRQSGISKATLYRYFTSKDDIVRGMVDLLISHLDSLQFDEVKTIADVMDGFQKIFVKSVFLAALTGSAFPSYLENKHADLYVSYESALEEMQKRSETFFEQAANSGFLRDLPFPLISLQFRNMLPVIIDMNFLEQNRMTLSNAIRDYYRMFLCQNLSEKYLYVTDENDTYHFVPEVAEELQNDFFIDSIRR